MDFSYEKLFGLLIPGQIPILDFEMVNGMLVCNLLNPASVTTICFFQNVSLPEGYAGALYYSIPPFENLQFIGAIANTRPSDIFTTGFALNPDVNGLEVIKLVIKVEPLENLKDLIMLITNNDIQKEYAKKVAQNLYNYMVSFNKEGMIPGQIGNEYLVIPANFLDKWIAKFEEKYKYDPNFIMKTSDN